MNGSITIKKTLGKNNESFITIKYYDSWQEQAKDLEVLVDTFEKLGIQVSYQTYTRKDGYNATYISIK